MPWITLVKETSLLFSFIYILRERIEKEYASFLGGEWGGGGMLVTRTKSRSDTGWAGGSKKVLKAAVSLREPSCYLY